MTEPPQPRPPSTSPPPSSRDASIAPRPTPSPTVVPYIYFYFSFSSRRRHTRYIGDWSSDVCSSDLHFHCSANPFGRNNGRSLFSCRQRLALQTSRNFEETTAAVGAGRANKCLANPSKLLGRCSSAEIRSSRFRRLLFRRAVLIFARLNSAPNVQSKSSRNLLVLISLAGNA